MKYTITLTMEVDGTSESIAVAKALRDVANGAPFAKITGCSTVLKREQ